MTDPAKTSEYGWTFAETKQRQSRLGLEMTPAERLQWLEETLDELASLVGLAKQAPESVDPQP